MLLASCCCPTSCDIHADEFDRASVGGNWSVSSGTWATDSSLYLKCTADGLIVCNTAHPGGLTEQWLDFIFKGDTAGDIARGVVAYQDDNNYLWAEVEIGSASVLRLWQRSAGVNTQLGDDRNCTADAAMWHRLRVCYDGTNLEAHFFRNTGNSSESAALETVSTTGTKTGLAASSLTTKILFDTFQYEKLQSATNTDCKECSGECYACIGGFAPAQLKLVVVSLVGLKCTTGSCQSRFDGTYYPEYRGRLAVTDLLFTGPFVNTACVYLTPWIKLRPDLGPCTDGLITTHVRAKSYIYSDGVGNFYLQGGLEWKTNLGVNPIQYFRWLNQYSSPINCLGLDSVLLGDFYKELFSLSGPCTYGAYTTLHLSTV
jgi:hypothetical protein